MKGVLLFSKKKTFYSKIAKSLHLHTLTHSLLLHCSLTGVLSYWTSCVRYLLLTVSSFKSLSVHNLFYLSPTVL